MTTAAGIISCGSPLDPDDLETQGQLVATALEERAVFKTADGEINALYAMTKRTMASLVRGYPEDCAHREKLGWTDHGTIMAESLLCAYGAQRLYEKWMQDFQDVQTADGSLPYVIPSHNWSPDAVFNWSGSYILIPWHRYRYYGDTRLIVRHFEDMKRYYRFVEGRCPAMLPGPDGIPRRVEHLIGGLMGDWLPPNPEGLPQEGATMSNSAYGCRLADILSRMAALLGNTVLDLRVHAALDSARTVLRTVRGTVSLHWKREGNGMRLSAELPWNTTGVMLVPCESGGILTVNGLPPADCPGVLSVQNSGGVYAVRVSSGRYTVNLL